MKNFVTALGVFVSLSLGFFIFDNESAVHADNNYFALSPSTPFTQDWSNASLITVNDNWSGVPSIIGYRGDDAAISTPVADAQTVVADYSGITNVYANQTVPNTFSSSGVAEFAITNPVVALSGSGASDFPNIAVRLDTSGCPSSTNTINVSYNVRDIDGSSDNAIQQVALQYRVNASGNYTNIPAGYIADATTGPSLATLVTPVSVTLPIAAQGQSQVHLRVLTANAAGNDEWVGIDDINITCQAGPTAANASVGGRVVTANGRGIASARVILYGPNLAEPRYAISNAFGYYRFLDVPSGQAYVVTVYAKGRTFPNASRVVSLNEDFADFDFVADPF
jgi:hypothetical protein